MEKSIQSKNKKPYKLVLTIGAGIILLVGILAVIITQSYVIITDRTELHGEIGVIDTWLNGTYGDEVVLAGNADNRAEAPTHGDDMLNFLGDLCYYKKLYYYCAADEDGMISSSSIIEALEWMAVNLINYVCLSLSSPYYSEELREWVLNHPDIKIYASYNNRFSSIADYPAMYEGVYASGSDRRIEYKPTDTSYTSSKILVINQEGISIYSGNSFLNIVTMIKDINEEERWGIHD